MISFVHISYSRGLHQFSISFINVCLGDTTGVQSTWLQTITKDRQTHCRIPLRRFGSRMMASFHFQLLPCPLRAYRLAFLLCGCMYCHPYIVFTVSTFCQWLSDPFQPTRNWLHIKLDVGFLKNLFPMHHPQPRWHHEPACCKSLQLKKEKRKELRHICRALLFCTQFITQSTSPLLAWQCCCSIANGYSTFKWVRSNRYLFRGMVTLSLTLPTWIKTCWFSSKLMSRKSISTSRKGNVMRCQTL